MRNDPNPGNESKSRTVTALSSLWKLLFGSNRSRSPAWYEQVDGSADSRTDNRNESNNAVVQPGNTTEGHYSSSATNYTGVDERSSGNGSAVRAEPSENGSGQINLPIGEQKMSTDTQNQPSTAQTVADTVMSTVQAAAPALIAAGVGAAAIANPGAGAAIGVALRLMPQALQISQTLMRMMQAPNVNQTALLQMQANLYQEILAAQQAWDAQNAAQGITTVSLPTTSVATTNPAPNAAQAAPLVPATTVAVTVPGAAPGNA